VLMKREKNEDKPRPRPLVRNTLHNEVTNGRALSQRAASIKPGPSRAGITFVPVIGARADRKLPVIDSY